MKISYHSIHQPRCPICLKHCKFLESIREHILGPSCSDIFSEQGCQLCLKIFGSSGSRNEHMEFCRLPAPIPLGTTASPTIVPDFDCQDSCDENHVGMRPRAIAIDCEMVGGGSDGSLELCARVCLVDEDEKVIFHTYVQPQMPVTNYRYEITGLTEEHLRDAMPLKQVQQKILQILHNGESIGKVRLESSDGGKARLLVGHGLAHDLDCLKLSYPNHLLSYDIQTGTHDPYEDCVSVMRLYKRIRGQVHQDEGNRTSTSTASNNIIPESDPWGSKEVDNLTPDELYAMSNSNFKCWCLDLKPRSS
ncbi:hypothetical protein TanjilG_05984 [Lupinus angustifolius]|uniref:Exonuclease domain-containing protein n=1 Tax=Lupinus angustifolius TaxID=3871 RepID=A0A4P1RE29_LUPAN|nr:hypothetical protein TanjilG_05984 [Lupinus angustifolius]